MPGDEPMPQSIQPEQHVLVYDRIAKNRRQTWAMMSLFVVLLVGVVALLADFVMRWTWFGAGGRGGHRDRGGGGYAILLAVAILFSILAPIAAQLIQLAISRQREYLADASDALLCRNPG